MSPCHIGLGKACIWINAIWEKYQPWVNRDATNLGKCIIIFCLQRSTHLCSSCRVRQLFPGHPVKMNWVFGIRCLCAKTEIPWQIRRNTGLPSSLQPLSCVGPRWTRIQNILVWFSSLYLSNGYCLRRAISKLEGAIPECLLEPTYFVPC